MIDNETSNKNYEEKKSTGNETHDRLQNKYT